MPAANPTQLLQPVVVPVRRAPLPMVTLVLVLSHLGPPRPHQRTGQLFADRCYWGWSVPLWCGDRWQGV